MKMLNIFEEDLTFCQIESFSEFEDVIREQSLVWEWDWEQSFVWEWEHP